MSSETGILWRSFVDMGFDAAAAQNAGLARRGKWMLKASAALGVVLVVTQSCTSDTLLSQVARMPCQGLCLGQPSADTSAVVRHVVASLPAKVVSEAIAKAWNENRLRRIASDADITSFVAEANSFSRPSSYYEREGHHYIKALVCWVWDHLGSGEAVSWTVRHLVLPAIRHDLVTEIGTGKILETRFEALRSTVASRPDVLRRLLTGPESFEEVRRSVLTVAKLTKAAREANAPRRLDELAVMASVPPTEAAEALRAGWDVHCRLTFLPQIENASGDELVVCTYGTDWCCDEAHLETYAPVMRAAEQLHQANLWAYVEDVREWLRLHRRGTDGVPLRAVHPFIACVVGDEDMNHHRRLMAVAAKVTFDAEQTTRVQLNHSGFIRIAPQDDCSRFGVTRHLRGSKWIWLWWHPVSAPLHSMDHRTAIAAVETTYFDFESFVPVLSMAEMALCPLEHAALRDSTFSEYTAALLQDERIGASAALAFHPQTMQALECIGDALLDCICAEEVSGVAHDSAAAIGAHVTLQASNTAIARRAPEWIRSMLAPSNPSEKRVADTMEALIGLVALEAFLAAPRDNVSHAFDDAWKGVRYAHSSLFGTGLPRE